MPDENVIPFGKHKGEKLADVMLSDPGWIDWATSQPWFRERFSALFAAIMNGGNRPDAPTPEHNRLQALFLDPLFAFAVHPHFKILAKGPKDKYGYDTHIEAPSSAKDIEVVFELWGWDVVLKNRKGLVGKYNVIGVELKPSIGDEYPTILRTVIHRAPHLERRIVLVDRFNAEMPLENAKAIFKASKVDLITLAEVHKSMNPYDGVEF